MPPTLHLSTNHHNFMHFHTSTFFKPWLIIGMQTLSSSQGGGNDLDTHICIPEAIACAIEKLVMLVYTTYGRPCYFIPFLHRLTFHSTIFDKNEHDITLQTTTHNHEPSHNLSSLPYNPILSVRSTLVLEVDGVHL